ncbi:MAG: Flp pilus assembly complex ATPase component TadA, partial [Blastocatellia bacterium]|nr:Flp pilus assembly complex ATPase component TadA [Blastocatellia bacterium]
MQVDQIKNLLEMAVSENISDILLVPDNPPIIKFSDRTTEYGGSDLTANDIENFAQEVLSGRHEELHNIKSKSVSYELKDIGRFRVSLFRSRFNLCLSIRIIPVEVRSFEDLNLPEQISSIAQLKRGLVLITGATGQGKSTTISAILEEINRTREGIIITIEDPIEFTYNKQKSVIIQRELGEDIPNLAQALD